MEGGEVKIHKLLGRKGRGRLRHPDSQPPTKKLEESQIEKNVIIIASIGFARENILCS